MDGWFPPVRGPLFLETDFVNFLWNLRKKGLCWHKCTNLVSMHPFKTLFWDNITLVHTHLILKGVNSIVTNSGGMIIKYRHYLLSFVSWFSLSKQRDLFIQKQTPQVINKVWFFSHHACQVWPCPTSETLSLPLFHHDLEGHSLLLHPKKKNMYRYTFLSANANFIGRI